MKQVYIIFSDTLYNDGTVDGVPQIASVFSSMDAALDALAHLQADPNNERLFFFIEPQEVQG